MNPNNREECDYSRVTQWREWGYDGASVTIASFEDLTSDHGSGTLGVINEIAPGARVLSRPRPLIAMAEPEAVTKLEAFFRSLVAEGVAIITFSMSKCGHSDALAALEKRILVDEGKMVLLASAGNDSGAIRKNSPAWYDHWWAVGAAEFATVNRKRVLRRNRDSNIDARLDIMAFTNIYKTNGAMFNGTSCAAPFLAAMLAIYYQFFKERAGRFPTLAEAWEMLKANAEDMEDPGFDNRTAIGLARLPAERLSVQVPEPKKEDPVMLDCPIPLTIELIPVGSTNRPGGVMKAEYITIHDTGNANQGADAAAHAAYLKGDVAAEAPVSWHFTVDDRGAYQHLPIDEHGWHAGDGYGPGNLTSVGIEICENTGADRAKAEANAVALVRWLLPLLGLDISRVVTHKRWYPGKDCPHLLLPRWNEFITMVKGESLPPVPSWDPAAEICVLAKTGLVSPDHKPGDPVSWGEFATVLNRLNAGKAI